MLRFRKVRMQIVLGLVAVIALCLVIRMDHHDGRLSSLQLTEKDFDAIVGRASETDSDLVQTIRFNDEKLFYDRDSDTFFYSLIENDVERFDPEVSFETFGTGIKLGFLETELNEQDIENNRTYDLIAYNSDSWHVYHLKCTTLPMMNIKTEHEIFGDPPVTFKMEMFDNRAEADVRYFDSVGTIHYRGASTSSYPKIGYKIKLYTSIGKTNKRNVSLLGMREDSSWMLYPGYTDPLRVRNVFSSVFWNRSCASSNAFGLANGYELKYIELFVNDSYHGLYALGFMPDEKMLQIDESQHEVIYKNRQWFDFTDPNKYPYDEVFKIVNDFSGFSEYDTSDRWKDLLDYCAVLNSGASFDEMMNYVDHDNYIDFWLFMYLLQGVDQAEEVNVKNFIITAKNTGDGYRMVYTPWDMDRTWGLGFKGDSTDVTLTRPFMFGPFGIYDPDHNEEVFQMLSGRYAELRSTKWSDDNLAELMDEFDSQIFKSGAYQRDIERWPTSYIMEPPYGLGTFKEYVLQRMEYCDEYFLND